MSLRPKLAIVGNVGSGKTTLARRVAAELDIPHVELDALHWSGGWTQATPAELRERVDAALDRDGWVVDGNYLAKLGTRVLERADTVVWLDPPLRTVLARVWRRTLRRIRTREELWGGNRETWRTAFLQRDSMFIWAVRMHRLRRRTWPQRLEPFGVVRLRSSAAVEKWFADYVEIRT